MKKSGMRQLIWGCVWLAAFAVWTLLTKFADVQAVGVKGTNVGLAGMNVWFHKLTGVHMGLYTVTDWLGLVPVAVCMGFGAMGLVQLIARRSLARVDCDLLALGLYYGVVIGCYLLFEEVAMHYRPVLIEGRMEASYPSSTTLLTLCVMPTFVQQVRARCAKNAWTRAVCAVATAFSALMVLGRLVSGVHWAADIIGGALLSAGLYALYSAAVRYVARKS